jgi:stress-induced morphogen
MMEPDQIQSILNQKFPAAEVTVQDLTGTRDHFQVFVLWKGFQGKGLIEQHQLVNQALKDCMEDGRIHALSIKTMALK